MNAEFTRLATRPPGVIMTEALEEIVGLAQTAEQSEKAAVIYGAAFSLHQEIGSKVSGSYQTHFRKSLAAVQAKVEKPAGRSFIVQGKS